MKTIGFGIIGAGLMGREFASAAARWAHLPEMKIRPQIVAVCDPNPAVLEWYRAHFAAGTQFTDDYHTLLANPQVEAVYCAVPHHLHESIYTAIIQAGKHLLGEKPFGIDLPANRNILQTLKAHPQVFVRCSSEFPFFPAVQRMGALIESGAFGRIIEVDGFFLHSSDLDPHKPLNWKRTIEFNGAYGVLGDLGLHVCHVPFRAGWIPRNVRAILSDIIKERPDGRGGQAPCRTWDNATLLCEAQDPLSGDAFPLTLKTQRIAPGEKNTWALSILGTKASARFSSKNPKLLQLLEYQGAEQIWQQLDMGHETAFKSITGGIFEFGFSDALLQMWAAFLYELVEGLPLKKFAACVTPAETALSHQLFTAALKSHASQEVIRVGEGAV
ncbi:MAG: Gfo/Idh/MocA family oxidoreductase [Lentisphaerae bacterium]|nr:Gfo/Idh/MocA family oxidoreductase [Lentisphaerota bacterium]